MSLTPRKINTFTLFKLPSVWLCGVRVKQLNDKECIVGIKHRWINQNPFKSIFWAVQGMAAELSTGALVMDKIRQSGKPISMLVINNNAKFSKKAKGKIRFTCADGEGISRTITKAIETGEGQTFWMKAVGVDESGDEVSVFNFEWTVKCKV